MWKPIREPSDLPPIGSEESESLDFKVSGYESGQQGCIEIARDVAQFASQLGGTILLGGVELESKLSTYVDVSDMELQKTRIADACNDRLDPRVSFTLDEILHSPSIRVLAINAFPAPSVVGVRITETRWEFPLRVGKTRKYLRPSEVESMLSRERRVQLMLESIPVESRGKLMIDAQGSRTGAYMLEVIGPYHSTLKTSGGGIFHVPHAFVEAVWPIVVHGKYAISIDAFLDFGTSDKPPVVKRHR